LWPCRSATHSAAGSAAYLACAPIDSWEAGAALPGDPRGSALIAAAAPGLLDALRFSSEFDPAMDH